MIPRTVADHVLRLSRQYPVITITGPRQSGKTTLTKTVFPQKAYVTLESIDNRNFAEQDPRGFLDSYPQGVIIDEVQNVPQLTSYIQEYVDREQKEGLYILTGSRNLELLSSISQSLAGRTALVTLLPFSFDEIYHRTQDISLEKLLYTGFYPRIFDKGLNPSEALSFYISMYLEKDLRELINVKDLSTFRTFLQLCAGRTGQILNLSSLGNDTGVSHNTIKQWLSILEASYVIKLLPSYHKNIQKRVIKSPKIFFLDTGLVSYLLGITEPQQISAHPLKGSLFETFVVSDILKQRLHTIGRDNLHFFRDSAGKEIDCILDYSATVDPIEIKLGKTVNSDFFKNLEYFKQIHPHIGTSFIIYGVDEERNQQGHKVVGWRKFGERFMVSSGV